MSMHAMTANGGRRGIAPLILNQVRELTLTPCFTAGKRTRNTLYALGLF
jgi:hypothetical protein